jgi:hypothetical protein
MVQASLIFSEVTRAAVWELTLTGTQQICKNNDTFQAVFLLTRMSGQGSSASAAGF